MYHIKPKPIPVHKLPPPMGTDPAHLQRLIDKAVEQMLIADEDAQVAYFDYIDKCKFRLERACQ